MGYLLNSGSGFLKDAVNVASDVKTYLINKGGYLYDTIRIGINDYGQRVLDDSGTIEGSSSAAASYKEITKTIFDASSLVLFPSGYKESKVYSHKPIDGSGDFTYTRGTDTATRVNEQGLIEKESGGLTDSMPRIDHTGGEPCLLFEPQRTNLLAYSEDFSQWTIDTGVTLTSNTTDLLSPDGTNNASKFTSSVSDKGFYKGGLSSTAQSTRSIYLRGATGGEQVTLKDPSGNGGSISATLTTSWVRYTHETDSGSSYTGFYISDIASTDTIYAWGAQWEEGDGETSYIPTSGATATRAFDDFGSLVYDDNFNSLTLYADVEMKNILRDDIKANIRFGHASNNNGSIRIFRSSASNTKRAVVNARTLSSTNIINNITATEDRVRIKITYDSSTGDWELFINESSEATGTSTDFNEFDTLELCGMGGTMRLYKLYIKNSI